MATAQASLPRRRQIIRALIKPGNTLPAIVWLFLVLNQAANSGFPPSISTAGLVVINTTALVLFMIRRDASKVGSLAEGVLAVSGTFVASFLKDAGQLHDAKAPADGGAGAPGLLGWAAALATLGRSFGIVPADRGLVRHGPYRFVRHPIYAFEALFFLGYLMAVPTPRSFIVIAVWSVLQVGRIIREERILGGYDQYRQQVRWRVLPGVW